MSDTRVRPKTLKHVWRNDKSNGLRVVCDRCKVTFSIGMYSDKLYCETKPSK